MKFLSCAVCAQLECICKIVTGSRTVRPSLYHSNVCLKVYHDIRARSDTKDHEE